MLDDRKSAVLRAVVQSYIETAQPVGSANVAQAPGVEVSPATVRNYFSELENLEFIMQPHTSSGRLPTEKGYKYYIENLMPVYTLSRKEGLELTEALKQNNEEHRAVKSLAKAVAEMAQNAAVVGIGSHDSYYTGLSNLFAQPEFKDWNRIVSLSDVLDKMDEVLAKLRSVRFEQPTVLIGADCPFGSLCGSVVVSLPPGYMIGILGPMRMDYAQATAIMKKIQLLISEKKYDET